MVAPQSRYPRKLLSMEITATTSLGVYRVEPLQPRDIKFAADLPGMPRSVPPTCAQVGLEGADYCPPPQTMCRWLSLPRPNLPLLAT